MMLRFAETIYRRKQVRVCPPVCGRNPNHWLGM
jgi:hypothetical protein